MSARRIVGAALTVLVGGAIVAGAGLLLQERPSQASAQVVGTRGTIQTPRGPVKHVYLHLDTYPDSMAGMHGPNGGPEPDWVSYGPSTDLTVPAHSLVTVTIRQYDGGERITNPYFARVHGTIGGVERVNGRLTRAVDPNTVGHTFTIHAAPTAQDPLFVSAPLPAVPDNAPLAKGSDYPAPNVVTFSFMTKGPGKYVWNCEFPCGDGYYAKFGGPMATRGWMSGTLTVA